MRRIRTCNARRRARERRSPDPDVLQAWNCYVDAIDPIHIHLVMADLTSPGEEREYGAFPRRLFRGIEPRLGLILRVEVVRGRGVRISTVPRAPSDRNDGAELVRLLSRLRDEAA